MYRLRRITVWLSQRPNEDGLCVKILSNDLFTNRAAAASASKPSLCRKIFLGHFSFLFHWHINIHNSCRLPAGTERSYPALAAVAFSTHLSVDAMSMSSASASTSSSALWGRGQHIFQCSWLDFSAYVFISARLRFSSPFYAPVSLHSNLSVFILRDLIFIICAVVNRTPLTCPPSPWFIDKHFGNEAIMKWQS